MRELDALLAGFLEQAYPALSPGDKERFSQLLELPDPELHAYLVGRNEAPDPELATLLEHIRSSAQA